MRKDVGTVDEYITSYPEDARMMLVQMRSIVKAAAPEAEETISYGMPCMKYHGVLVWYAAAKNHIGLYAKSEVQEAFGERLKSYSRSKGTIRFPIGAPLPAELITDIVHFRIKANLDKAAIKTARKAK